MKKLLTSTLAFALATSMGVTAFAANTATNDGTAGTNIDVNGKYQAGTPTAEVISVDLVWDDMNFTYTGASKGTWNPGTHAYINAKEAGWTWDSASDTKTAPNITVTNHSNTAVKANFAFNSGVSGLNGSFTNDALILANAEGTKLADAPKDETTFSLGGSGIDANQTLGTITVTVEKVISTAEELLETANKTGTFTLAGNIDLGTSALEIASENYVLDLNGHTVFGSSDREGAIRIAANSNVTIKNGTVNNTCTEYGWAVHEKKAKLILENCTLNSYSSGLFSEGGTASVKNCNFKTQITGHYNITNYNGCALTLSGNVNLWGGAGLSNQLGATTTVLPGTYNFNVTDNVDTTSYDVTTDTEAGTWIVTAK